MKKNDLGKALSWILVLLCLLAVFGYEHHVNQTLSEPQTPETLASTPSLESETSEPLLFPSTTQDRENKEQSPNPNQGNSTSDPIEPSSIPPYRNSPFVILNDNKPAFTASEITSTAFESYSDLDFLGRCGAAFACCGKELMPEKGEKRESISSIYPSGWVQAKYDAINGGYLYNRCHLIGWQLSAENANRKNLITGTKYMNTHGMLPFENMIADYIKETGNHVMYRVTPVYKNQYDLVASGVRLEAYSVEDEGEGICFHVYCYNVQPNITIDYATGNSHQK